MASVIDDQLWNITDIVIMTQTYNLTTMTAPVTANGPGPDDDHSLFKCPVIQQSAVMLLLIESLYGLVFALGMFGNSLVVYVVVRYSLMQTTTNIYILNLALADVSFLISIPFLITTIARKSWIFGPFFCKFYMITASVNQISSTIFLLVMSFDRYLAICHPVTKARYRTKFASRIISLVAWTTSAVIITPLVIYSKVIYGSNNAASCNIIWRSNPEISSQVFTLYMFVLGFFTPLSLIVTFYLLVLRRVRVLGSKNRSTTTTITATTAKNTNKSNVNAKHKKVTKMVVTIIVVYVLCWLPYYSSQLFLVFSRQCQTRFSLMFHLLAGCLAYSNSTMNPILYTFLNDNFKNSFIRAFISCKSCSSQPHGSHHLRIERNHKHDADTTTAV